MDRLELIARLLHAASTLSLSTCDAAGTPCVAPLFYLADDDLCLYWFSSSSSRHSRNLKANPAAAVAVYRPTSDWKKICGVQMSGEVSVVRDRARRDSLARSYSERFGLGNLFRTAISHSSLYQFRPSWVRYIDNSVRFGYKFELDAPVGR